MDSDSIGALYFFSFVIWIVLAIYSKDILLVGFSIYSLMQSICFIFYGEGIIGTTKYLYNCKKGKLENL